MTYLQDKYAALDALTEAQAEIRRLREALQDIAGSDLIPTPVAAWKWCKDLATSTISSQQGKST